MRSHFRGILEAFHLYKNFFIEKRGYQAHSLLKKLSKLKNLSLYVNKKQIIFFREA
jgi:hypothetical protein